MDIILKPNFNGTFSGSPTVWARHTFGSPQNLSDIQNLKLEIETIGAHGNIFVRLENNENKYAEFNMGGDMTGDAGTRTQNLEKMIKDCTYTEQTEDFDASDIVSVYIYFVDDGNETGIADATETSIGLAYDTEVAHDLEFVDGFSTEITRKVELSSTTIQLKDRPVNPNTGEYINETLIVVSDGTAQAIKDFATTPSELGKILGEVFWIEFVSENSTTGVSTWDILQRGGGNVRIPPALADFRKSLRHTEHAQGSTVIIAILKGLIQEGVDQAKKEASGIAGDFEAHKQATSVQISSKKLEFQGQAEVIEEQQDDFEESMKSDFDNFVANQYQITAKVNDGDSTKADMSSGVWLDGLTPRDYAGATVSVPLDQTTYYELQTTTGTLVDNTNGFNSGNFPMCKIVADAVGITSIKNYGAAYQVSAETIISFAGATNFVYTNDLLSSFDDADSTTWTLTHDENGSVETITDGETVYTVDRNANGNLSGLSIS